jgi:hypothetical protein
VNVGQLGTVLAAQKRFDLVVRKNEPIVGRIVWGGLAGPVFVLVHFQDFGGLVELALLVCAAIGLDLAEQKQSAFELAGEGAGSGC